MAIGRMITPVLNQPRHAWYQKRYHNRLPRRAESKKYLDASFMTKTPPVVPVGWNFGWRIGVSGTGNTVGADRSATPPFGAINPSTFTGVTVGLLYTNTADTISLAFGPNPPQQQLPGVGTITLTAQGFGGSIVLPWVVGNLRYRVVSAPFGTFIRANIGKVVGFTLVGSALQRYTQPYPWEGFNLHAAINEWVEEQDLEVPEEWFQLTIAKKKEFLAQEYGE